MFSPLEHSQASPLIQSRGGGRVKGYPIAYFNSPSVHPETYRYFSMHESLPPLPVFTGSGGPGTAYYAGIPRALPPPARGQAFAGMTADFFDALETIIMFPDRLSGLCIQTRQHAGRTSPPPPKEKTSLLDHERGLGRGRIAVPSACIHS